MVLRSIEWPFVQRLPGFVQAGVFIGGMSSTFGHAYGIRMVIYANLTMSIFRKIKYTELLENPKKSRDAETEKRRE